MENLEKSREIKVTDLQNEFVFVAKNGQLEDVKRIFFYISSRSFNNYVDKMRWVGGQKMPILVHVQGKNVHVEVGRWSKKGKIMST